MHQKASVILNCAWLFVDFHLLRAVFPNCTILSPCTVFTSDCARALFQIADKQPLPPLIEPLAEPIQAASSAQLLAFMGGPDGLVNETPDGLIVHEGKLKLASKRLCVVSRDCDRV